MARLWPLWNVATSFTSAATRKMAPRAEKPNGWASRIRFFAPVVFALFSFWNSAVSANPAPMYGAPFYDNGYCSSNRYPTVDADIQGWWDCYSRVWGVVPYGTRQCSYNVEPQANGSSTGVFAALREINGCSGGNGLYGTAYCPSGYVLSGSSCSVGSGYYLKAPDTPPARPGGV